MTGHHSPPPDTSLRYPSFTPPPGVLSRIGLGGKAPVVCVRPADNQQPSSIIPHKRGDPKDREAASAHEAADRPESRGSASAKSRYGTAGHVAGPSCTSGTRPGGVTVVRASKESS